MRTHITGTENRYYASDEAADANLTPALIHKTTARLNSDNKTWLVYRTTDLSFMEKSEILKPRASLREAWNLVRSDEENPAKIATLPALRQHPCPDYPHEYWRNMLQPV